MRQPISFVNGFEAYREGLETVVDDLYDQFVVPFGKKHRGKEIRQCRDKPWLLWAMGKRVLVKKVRILCVLLGQTSGLYDRRRSIRYFSRPRGNGWITQGSMRSRAISVNC